MLQALLDDFAFGGTPFDAAASVPLESRAPEELTGRERRAAPRHREDRLHWVRVVRLQFGQGVSLIDLSSGGARLDSPVALRPTFISALEIIGAGLETVVPFRVLRCEVGELTADGVVYRGACEFMRPIEIPNLARPAVQAAHPEEVLELDVVLKNLVRRACGDGGTERFSDPQLVQALKALHLRAANVFSDPMGQRLSALLRLVLPAMERRTGVMAVLPQIETQLRRVVPGAAVRFAGAVDGGGPTQNSILIGTPGLAAQGPLVIIHVPRTPTLTAWQHRVTRATVRVIALLQRLEPDRSIDVIRPVRQPDAAPAPSPEPAAPALPAEEVTPKPAPFVAELPTDTSTVGIGWQRVVVRYSEGQILKGYTQDFHASRAHFTLNSAPLPTTDDAVIVPLVRLKAVFFVRDFAGDPRYVECNDTAGPERGRRVEVTLNDGEIVVGTTLNYRSDGQGFFVTPIDPLANNIRVFVVAQSVRQVRFPTRPTATV